MTAPNGCTVREVPAYAGPRGRVPRYEVFAPTGQTFCGPHSVYCWTKEEVLTQAQRPTEPCTDPECDCMGV